MYNFVMPAEDWDETNPNKQAILHLILKHRREAERLNKLERYYKGEHDILNDTDRENKLVCNHAKDISDTASSYFIGNPVSYKSEEDITVITDELENAGADEADGDNGLDLSIYGRAYEYIYTQKDETELRIKNLPPQNTFVVIDNSIEENELFAVYYWEKKDDTDQITTKYVATILTENFKYVLNILDKDEYQSVTEQPEPHYKGKVPVIEYRNNKLGIGDFELQIPLIDAYNVLMSDRVTDKEQFIDAILMVYGTLLGDPQEDEKENNHEDDNPMKRLHKEKMMEMPADSRAEYLTRTFDESGVEILKKAIEQDIHKFSHIPCMSDESFGGNVSGVAMEFKLLGMENITKVKSRYYKKGLRKRIRIFANFLQMRSCTMVDATAITPVFTRALPKNLLEISQYVANLWGKVSKRTLLAQIPFVDNVDEEVQAVEKEEQESIEKQQKLFGNNVNELPDLEDDDKEVDDE